MKISGKQVAAARALLGWSQEQLALAADVVMQTVNRWETGYVEPRKETVERIVRAIEERGVEFLNGGAPGVRFKPKSESAESESAGK